MASLRPAVLAGGAAGAAYGACGACGVAQLNIGPLVARGECRCLTHDWGPVAALRGAVPLAGFGPAEGLRLGEQVGWRPSCPWIRVPASSDSRAPEGLVQTGSVRC